MNRSHWLGVLAMIVMYVPTQAQDAARSIGVHFPSDRDNARLEEDEMAGLVPQIYWNSADGGTINAGENGTRFDAAGAEGNNVGDTSNITLPDPNLAGFLLDSTGSIAANETTARPTSVTWQSNGTWNTTNGSATPNAKLTNGYIDAFTNAGLPEGVRVSFADIPYPSYDVIVYVGTDGNNRQGNAVFCDQPTCTEDFQPSPDLVEAYADAGLYREWTTNSNFGGDPTFQVITADAPGEREMGNYFIAPELSSTTFTVEIVNWTTDNNNGIHAVQIIERPAAFDPCDFDTDGDCDIVDLDNLLYLGQTNQDLTYDLDGDNDVDLDDRDEFLLAIGSLPGDANFSGKDDAEDLNAVGIGWQQPADSYAGGDFDGSGFVDAVDLNTEGIWWQLSSTDFAAAQAGSAAASAVPEPTSFVLVLAGLMALYAGRRQ